MKKHLHEIKMLLKITIPIFLAQISQTSMSLINSIMIGHLKENNIAAISVGISIWSPIILFGHGLLLSLVPTVSRIHGSGKINKIPEQINNAYWLATLISLVIMIVLWNSDVIIHTISQVNPIIEQESIKYIRILLWSTPGYLYFQVIQNQCEGLLKPKPAMVIGLIGLLFNIVVSYTLISEKFHCFNYGSTGCGISAIIVYWFMFIAMKKITKNDILINYNIKNKNISNLEMYLPNYKIIWNLFKMGFPIALSLFCEITLFTLITLLIASMETFQIIAHQIALNISSTIFILPLSIATAASIRLGFYLGKKSFSKISTIILSSQIIGLIISTTISTFIILFHYQIITLYTKNANIIKLTKQMLFITASYQIFDFFQIIGNGILRSYKDTNIIFIITCTSYWIVGFPFGYFLALTNYIVPHMGAIGFWYGILIALITSSIMILFRIYILQKK
ncbi:multidrug resistance protein NorM [Buchnera aphidicola str. Bp (Baizongia pistaciae)]|uniref:Probable multidrug resistance protein NorM n=1 Tax=Buchnera aphidicola subsp. Baizongia pistaciae (strain Bp) TaxID=224915 RepID=NORM_BUCBP|nr:MATE family efflux transporter [Buchnera aphidicola]Q89AX2.1 RecName: Full=Probable multidrug resistance protein NorM; AltName: Full=Multidrug-efflux transporter [Buchnera aphidicola str. Bp (Baizongia pistaciae)]AAO26840.1 multidrug resistance protein NorM [Buchnera aphidicola str. Bp (Baizongia pistaciae)]